MFDIIVYSAELNRALRKNLVGTAICSSRYRGDIEKPGAQVTIFSPSNINLQDYTGEDLDVQTPEPGEMTVTVDQAKAFAYEVDDLTQLKSPIDAVEAHVEEARYALGDAADQHILGELTGSASQKIETSAGTAAGFAKVLQDADVALSEANLPRTGRVLTLPPKYRSLINEYVIDATSDRQAVREGYVGRAFGFDIYESNNCPTADSGEETKVSAYAGHPMGAVFASKLLKVQLVEPTLRFGQIMKGLFVFQAKLWKPEVGLHIEITQ